MKGREDYRLAHLRDLLGGQYRFEGVLGEGGSAVVYRVTNLRLGRFEALKVLTTGRPDDPGFGVRFTNEAKLAATLDHPNIVKVYDFGIDEGIFWYTMQYVDGPTLDRVYRSTGPLIERAIAQIAVPLLDALDYIHRNRIVHRDIKPANIIIDEACRPYLMDFGIARSADAMKLTQTGILVGTPVYLSPEVVSGLEPDGQSDIYSLGVTFYELLTGEFPFPAASTVQAIFSRMHGDPVPLSERRPEMDPRHEAIIMRSLERERGDRYPNAGRMRDDYLALLRAVGEPPGPALEASFGTKLWLGNEIVPTEGALYDPTLRARIAPVRRWRKPPGKRLLTWAVGLTGLVAVAIVLLWAAWDRSPSGPAGGEAPSAPGAAGKSPSVSGTPSASVVIPAADGRNASRPAAEAGATSPAPARKPAASGPPASGDARRAGPLPGASAPEPLVRRPVRPPQLLDRATIRLPEGIPEGCRGRTVSVSVIVGEDGRVKTSRVLSAVAPECGRAALQAVARYVFKPAVDARGQPVEAATAVSVELF
ncbi:MAG: protein kinase [Acidobacteria bacterium]|nr:protein kinase [Acidobacteriota bacterium]